MTTGSLTAVKLACEIYTVDWNKSF